MQARYAHRRELQVVLQLDFPQRQPVGTPLVLEVNLDQL